MLLIGYGNPGRGDDGLGPAFAARIAALGLPGLTVLEAYQLTVDHALDVARASDVVFVDAQMQGDGPFSFSVVAPARGAALASHTLDPPAVLALAASLYGAGPGAHLLGITGRDFGAVKEGLSPEAEANLDHAEAAFLTWLEGQSAAPAQAPEPTA